MRLLTTDPDELQPAFQFQARREEADGVTALAVSGELDLAVEAPFQQALADAVASSSTLVVDLCACTFMDSRALGVLLGGWSAAKRLDVPFAVACTPDTACHRLFDLALDGLIPLHPDRAAALRAVRTA